MNQKEIPSLVDRQRSWFRTGATLSIHRRIQTLKSLKTCIRQQETAIHEALKKDLGKSAFESYMCETGLVLSEITYMLNHIRQFARETVCPTPLAQFPGKSFKKPSPYGVVLIISPWNYPFLLTLNPLIDAIAAGNTVIVKPSAYAPSTSQIIRTMLQSCFDERHIAVVTGGRAENSCLLQQHFDYIFFTGSQAVGREVMAHAAAHLTPVTLELGGKSPCVVDSTANLPLAARRIVFGKFLNCGQTCVAPDYIYCHSSIKESLIREIKKQIVKQFGKHPLCNKNYGKIINEKHFNRLTNLTHSGKTVMGGAFNSQTLQIEPTILDHVTFGDQIMEEEIFGPILPVLTYKSLDEAIHKLNTLPHPLALYIFTRDKKASRKVLSRCGFGGGCINDTIIHLATSEMGFGGFGESGMGAYHGKEGFDTFSHHKSIVDKKTWLDLPMRYQPYNFIHQWLIGRFLH